MKKTTTIFSVIVVSALLLSACSALPFATRSEVQALAQNLAEAVQAKPSDQADETVAAQPVAEQKEPVLQPSGSTQLAAFEGTLEQLYKDVNPTVVNIRATVETTVSANPLEGTPFEAFPFGQNTPDTPSTQTAVSQGSGFVWDQEGHIVTNNHVIDGAKEVTVTFADGTVYDGKVIGSDPDSDLAVIKIDAAADVLRPITLADSDTVSVGQLAVAIGNPFGLNGTMTSGIVSAIGRSISAGDSADASGSTYSIPDIIQTDASINPGNSGGVLVDGNGALIGVTAAIESSTNSSAGVGFAIPSNIVARVIPELISSGSYTHTWIGIRGGTLTPDIAEANGLERNQRGAYVVDVTAGGPADKAGLRGSADTKTIDGQEIPVGGDIITAIDGQVVHEFDDLVAYLAADTAVGQTVKLSIMRDGKSETVDLVLQARPNSTQTASTQTEGSDNGNNETPRNSNGQAWIGISGVEVNTQIAEKMDLPQSQEGVLVTDVASGSPADKAGLRAGDQTITLQGQRVAIGGDIITAIDGQPVVTVADLRAILGQTQPGQTITVDVLRDGQPERLEVTLTERPNQ